MNTHNNYSPPEVKPAERCEGLKILFGCLLAGVVAFLAALGTVYCSGRWNFTIGPEIFFAKGVGLFVYIFVCLLLLQVFREKGKNLKFVAVCFSLCLLLASFSKANNSMMKWYVAGFEQAVFSVATVEQWDSVPMVVKKYEMDPSKDHTSWEGDLLPDFVWKLRRGSFATTTFDGNSVTNNATNDLHTSIIWRGFSFDPAIEIGPQRSNISELSNILYRNDYSTNISFLLIGGSD